MKNKKYIILPASKTGREEKFIFMKKLIYLKLLKSF